MDSKGSNKLSKILIVLGCIFIICGILFPTIKGFITNDKENENENEIKNDDGVLKATDDFELNSYSSFNNQVSYGTYTQDGDKFIQLSFKAKEYNLPSNLYDYRDYIRLRLTYGKSNNKVYDCKIVNYETGEVIDDLSELNLKKMFDIEYGKDINEEKWIDSIKLSKFDENAIYKFTANSSVQFPNIENDTGKNCVVYLKEKDETSYEREVKTLKTIKNSSSISYSDNEYNSGDSFYIMYKTISNDELIKSAGENKIIYLSKYKKGDKIEADNFEEYIYNDTSSKVTIEVKSNFGEYSSVTIGADEIYGYDWMINSALVK